MSTRGRFDRGLTSAAQIIIIYFDAGMAELADAQASGACGGNIVWVQVPFPALYAAYSQRECAARRAPSHKVRTTMGEPLFFATKYYFTLYTNAPSLGCVLPSPKNLAVTD